jgi:hypothetical protein
MKPLFDVIRSKKIDNGKTLLIKNIFSTTPTILKTALRY